ncbi:delta(14)-sterol reductase TM7SF2-like isoform X2 [Tigriopus californicus]|nr:delta(14)-sterol reductase TM7SF2-like isoform X2 [Tigriopus californicus]
MAPPRKSRSSSRGRTSAKSPKSPNMPKKKSPGRTSSKSSTSVVTSATSTTPFVKENKMDFQEGGKVMARWPGTNLFFRANVTYVREDDNEYDVLYEDGTVYTVKAKDVKSNLAVPKKDSRRSRSRSRGRSPARKNPGRPTRKSTGSPNKTVSPARTRRSSRSAVKAPKPEPAPMRSSARLANAKIELSSDEDDGPKAIPNPSHSKGKKNMGFLFNMDFSWVQSLFFMVLSPLVLIALHLNCQGKSCKLVQPAFPKKLTDYWNLEAFLAVVAFSIIARLLAFIPLGRTVRSASGHNLRLNGFLSMLTILAVVPGLVYRKVDLKFVSVNYFKLMISALIFSVVASIVAFISARWAKRSNINPKGNTGNFIVDLVNGREFNPWFVKVDLKFQTFRLSMMALAMINVLLVVQSIQDNSGKVNPTVVLAATFQVLYALDKLFFEEYYFFTSDAMNSGYGFSLINSYFSFPFIPTLITRYIIANNIQLLVWQLVAIGFMNALGYVIFRASETQRCEFAKDPNSPTVKHLAYVAANSGRRILCSGWNGLVRYPNYLGELLMQWSWVLPAAKLAGSADLLIYYLPVFTTLMLIFRVAEANTRNRRRYGPGWDTYCQKVSANVIPKVY